MLAAHIGMTHTFVTWDKRIHIDIGPEMGGLGAPFAIFGTFPGTGVDYRARIENRHTEFRGYLFGRRIKFPATTGRGITEGICFFGRYLSAGKNLFFECFYECHSGYQLGEVL